MNGLFICVSLPRDDSEKRLLFREVRTDRHQARDKYGHPFFCIDESDSNILWCLPTKTLQLCSLNVGLREVPNFFELVLFFDSPKCVL